MLLLLLVQPAEAQQLYKEGAALEEGRSLAELGVENDDELAVAYRGAGERRRREEEAEALCSGCLLALLASLGCCCCC